MSAQDKSAGETSATTILSVCTHCGAERTIPNKYLGKKVRCTSCKESFLVEAAPAAEAPKAEPTVAPKVEPKEEPKVEAETEPKVDAVVATSPEPEPEPEPSPQPVVE